MSLADPVLSPVVISDDIRLDFCQLDDDRDMALEEARQTLSSEESARAARFKFARDAERYIRGRGFMRQALGHALNIAPARVPLAYGPYGKPHLSDNGPCHFNLSNSGGLAVLALCKTGPVGVDLELADRTVDPMSLAQSCFVRHEIAALAACPDAETQRATFFDFWTAKEALMKLTGLGMTLAPKSISLRLEGNTPKGFLAPEVYHPIVLQSHNDAARFHISLATG